MTNPLYKRGGKSPFLSTVLQSSLYQFPYLQSLLVFLSIFYLTTAIINDCYNKVMTCTALAYSVLMTSKDTKVTPTDDTNYSCHIKP